MSTALDRAKELYLTNWAERYRRALIDAYGHDYFPGLDSLYGMEWVRAAEGVIERRKRMGTW